MIFHYADKLTVEISLDIESFFYKFATTYDFRIESGGILIGKMKDISHIIITNLTVPQQKDYRYSFRFHRSEVGHQQLMDQIWKDSEYKKMYLGEWHTHREPYPAPSCVDSSGWLKISKKKQNSPWMLFIILGQQKFRLWTIDKGVIKELIPDAE